jgi:hypothetical protein
MRGSFGKSSWAWHHIPHSSGTIYSEIFFSVLNILKKGG